MITFNEIDTSERIPFIKVEFDNSLNFDPFDVKMRALLLAEGQSKQTITKPIYLASKTIATGIFGAGSTIERLTESWYKKIDTSLYAYPIPANVKTEEFEAILAKIIAADKTFDIIILPRKEREFLRITAQSFADGALKDGAIRPLVMSAIQSTYAEAIAFMTVSGEPPSADSPAIDGGIIPNLDNLSILPVPVILSNEGKPNAKDDEITVAFAASVTRSAQNNPARPFNGLLLEDIAPFREEEAFLRSELNDLVKNGLSACSLNGNGEVALERVVSTRRQNEKGEEDYSQADANVNLIDNYLKKTFTSYFWNKYVSQRALLVDDNATIPANLDFPVIKPKTAKAEALNVFRIWQEKLIVEDEAAFLDSLKVEKDGKILKFSFAARYIQGLLGIGAKIYRAR